MKNIFIKILIVLLGGMVLFLASCGSSPRTEPGDGEPELTVHELDRKAYYGMGKAEGDTFLQARNMAIMEAVRKSVKDLLGDAVEEANFIQLDQNLYNSKNVNAYIHKDSLESLGKKMISDGLWQYECKVDVDLVAVRNSLKAYGLYGEGGGSSQASASEVVAAETEPEEEYTITVEYEKPTEDEQRYILRYIDTMTYVVYFNDESGETEFMKDSAIGIANEYLSMQNMEFFDLDQIQTLKEDQAMVFEEEVGEDVSVVQWIAQKLNADVYIEIDGKTSGESKMGGKHYGQANITIKAFETSTGDMLGSQTWASPKTASTSSQNDAKLNAIKVSVYKSMPNLIDQAKTKMTSYLVRGIRYEVVIQNTPDSKTISRFRSKLKDRVKDVETVSQSSEETKFYVRMVGSIDDLEDMIYDVTDLVPGLEGIDLVLKRGKSMTFNSGM